MAEGKVFVDTNIFVYAHDKDAGRKNRIAHDLLMEMWERRCGPISTQVLQELYVTLTRKVAKPLSQLQARSVLQSYLSWEVIVNDPAITLRAGQIEEENVISYWDALILSAASEANADSLLTEDLNHGQIIEGISIENPFRGDVS